MNNILNPLESVPEWWNTLAKWFWLKIYADTQTMEFRKKYWENYFDPYTGSGVFCKLIMPQPNTHSLVAYARVKTCYQNQMQCKIKCQTLILINRVWSENVTIYFQINKHTSEGFQNAQVQIRLSIRQLLTFVNNIGTEKHRV